jgi:hypothetical protein
LPRAKADEENQTRQAVGPAPASPSTDPDAAQAAAKCVEAGRAAYAASDLEQSWTWAAKIRPARPQLPKLFRPGKLSKWAFKLLPVTILFGCGIKPTNF